jgi:hypothetical protein
MTAYWKIIRKLIMNLILITLQFPHSPQSNRSPEITEHRLNQQVGLSAPAESRKEDFRDALGSYLSICISCFATLQLPRISGQQ